MNSRPFSSLVLNVMVQGVGSCVDTEAGTDESKGKPVSEDVARALTSHLFARGEYAAARDEMKDEEVVRGVVAVTASAGTATSFPSNRACALTYFIEVVGTTHMIRSCPHTGIVGRATFDRHCVGLACEAPLIH